MAISDKLTKLETDITNAYNSIQTKGGTVPSNKNTENLSSSISSIKSYEDEYVKLICRRNLFNPTSLPDLGDYNRIDEYAFTGCEDLALTSLPNGITTIDSYAFKDCKSLALTSLPNSVTKIGNNAFEGCTNLALTTLPNGITSIDSYTFSMCSNIVTFELPSSCKKIYGYAFQFSGLTELTLPETFTNLYNYALYYCTNLTTLKVLAPTPPTVDSTNTFFSCSKLTRIEVPSASLEAYKTANVWSNYADIMVGV